MQTHFQLIIPSMTAAGFELYLYIPITPDKALFFFPAEKYRHFLYISTIIAPAEAVEDSVARFTGES